MGNNVLGTCMAEKDLRHIVGHQLKMHQQHHSIAKKDKLISCFNKIVVSKIKEVTILLHLAVVQLP